MPKLGFSLQEKYSVPMSEVIRLLGQTGFDALSITWQRDVCLKDTLRAAEQQGLILQSLHGPLRGIPGLWSREEACSASITQDFLQAADDCAAFGIPVLVVHSWGGYDDTFEASSLYFDNFDRLVERAHRNGIQIAFENLEGPEYLAALMARYKSDPAVGFCWDSGHEHCYTPGMDFLSLYGQRLLMTHLNDNYGLTSPDGRLQGTDDLHLIPYDGKLDWTQTMNRLSRAKPQEILNFELKIRPKGDRCICDLYSRMPLAQYFARSYEAACRVALLYPHKKQGGYKPPVRTMW